MSSNLTDFPEKVIEEIMTNLDLKEIKDLRLVCKCLWKASQKHLKVMINRRNIKDFSKLLSKSEEFHIGNIEILTILPYKTEYKGILKLFNCLKKKNFEIDVVEFKGFYDDKMVNQARGLLSIRTGKTLLITSSF